MTRYCDLVMKGGITSGVVYPRAAVTLSKHYRFVNIGGTSAGAIAAAAVAAAEHGRRTGAGKGFSRVEELPEWLGSNMLSLFQPTRRSRPIFFALIASLSDRKLNKALGILNAFWASALLGLLPGAALIAAALLLDGGAGLRSIAIGCGFLVALGGLMAGPLVSAIWRLRGLPSSYFGLCPGNDRGEGAAHKPLTRWLADLLDELAGKTPDSPLTFGDLRKLEGGPEPGRGVNLEMITTCLTNGRPYKLPFEGNKFWFDPDEFRDLFPERIVRWMKNHAQPSEHADAAPGLCHLPTADDLPVVVAARMSLSFPPLIAAVPLYARNFSVDKPSLTPERCWFSDGGITSNFPIHFFDSPIPRWPTFALNLVPFPRGKRPSDVERDNVYLPDENGAGSRERWDDFGKVPVLGSLPGFLFSVFRTAQNWMDNGQMLLAGNRDRIAHVNLTKSEGGMNLTMERETILRLAERGKAAAEELASRFSPAPPRETVLTWENQRWVRYLNYMRLLERDAHMFPAGYRDKGPGERTIAELIARPHTPPGYPLQPLAQREFARKTTKSLLALFDAWDAAQREFTGNAPKPPAERWTMPKL
jgi:predicted acylesterase/phospholipase RssA